MSAKRTSAAPDHPRDLLSESEGRGEGLMSDGQARSKAGRATQFSSGTSMISESKRHQASTSAGSMPTMSETPTSQFTPRSAYTPPLSSSEGGARSSALRMSSARGSAQNRQQFFQRSARVSSLQDQAELSSREERNSERSVQHRVKFAQGAEFEEDMWMDVDSPAGDGRRVTYRADAQQAGMLSRSAPQAWKETGAFKTGGSTGSAQSSAEFDDAPDKAEEMEQFQTPPSTPLLTGSAASRRKILRCVEKAERVQSSSFSSPTSSSTASGPVLSWDPSLTSYGRKHPRDILSSESSNADYQDAMSEFQMSEASVRQHYSDKSNVQRPVSDISGSSTSQPFLPSSPSVSATTMGLFQRRKMRRQILRLQSLEEVKMSKFSSESSDCGGVIPEDVEEDLAEAAFMSVSTRVKNARKLKHQDMRKPDHLNFYSARADDGIVDNSKISMDHSVAGLSPITGALA
ncbi:hypothetical protein PoB_003737700 [Plakobranchus ocellatus]|uniref:Uncharacterized protein n=1 Tax=Plakobranchus ocellatus TaxID=259542 RepID=A0AAV4AV49_9GAST|nr:hypothetical protein PoB_003737700 [Plakobranchus ocellatus]